MTALSDNILLKQMTQQEDTVSFETLFFQQYDRVYGLLYRLVGNRVEAEDLTQEAFIKLYKHAFDATKQGSLRKADNIGAWLYRVATNLGYNALRSRRRRQERDTLLVPDQQTSSGTETAVERNEEATAVRNALAQLSHRDVQLLLLRQMGLSYKECAVACGVAPGSVGTLLRRASEAFRAVYSEVNHDTIR